MLGAVFSLVCLGQLTCWHQLTGTGCFCVVWATLTVVFVLGISWSAVANGRGIWRAVWAAELRRWRGAWEVLARGGRRVAEGEFGVVTGISAVSSSVAPAGCPLS